MSRDCPKGGGGGGGRGCFKVQCSWSIFVTLLLIECFSFIVW